MLWPWTPAVLKFQAISRRMVGAVITTLGIGMAIGAAVVYWILGSPETKKEDDGNH